MATPTTLKDLWDQELADARTALAEDKSDLTSALQDRETARSALQAALEAVGDRRRAIDALWKAMPAAGADGALPADAEADLTTIRADLAALLGEEAEAVGARQTLVRLEARVFRLQARVRDAVARVRDAQAALTKATTDDARRTAWASAVGSAPLSGVSNAAHDFLNGTDYTDARSRVEAAIPPLLRQVAAARGDLERARMASARELSAFVVEKFRHDLEHDGGADGLVRSRRFALSDVDAALGDFARHAQERLERATSLITAADPAVSSAAAAELADAPSGAAAAATAYEHLLQAETTVEERLLALRKAEIQCAVDPTGAHKAAVTRAQGRLTTAQTQRDAKLATLAPKLDAFRAWEAAVPGTAWRAFDDLTEQAAVLDELHGTDAGGLADDAASAEEDLVAALLSDLAARRADARWPRVLTEVQATETSLQESFADRLLKAVAGACYVPGLDGA